MGKMGSLPLSGHLFILVQNILYAFMAYYLVKYIDNKCKTDKKWDNYFRKGEKIRKFMIKNPWSIFLLFFIFYILTTLVYNITIQK